MKNRIIVTDLTRFNNPEQEACMAGIDASGQCIRPLPYLKMEQWIGFGIKPGSILDADFTPVPNLKSPHTEDHSFSDMTYFGNATAADFKKVLDDDLSLGLADGFSCALLHDQKHIPVETTPSRSIITIKINPAQINLIADKFDSKKQSIKVSFTDLQGHKMNFLSLTDIGFFSYAKAHGVNNLIPINNFIRQQSEVYLRIGLSRIYTSPAPNIRTGYWMQVNGIYTFPNYYEQIRNYK